MQLSLTPSNRVSHGRAEAGVRRLAAVAPGRGLPGVDELTGSRFERMTEDAGEEPGVFVEE